MAFPKTLPHVPLLVAVQLLAVVPDHVVVGGQQKTARATGRVAQRIVGSFVSKTKASGSS